MKKFITAAVAALIIAFSAVPVVYGSVDSPVATTQPETVAPTTSPVQKDNSNQSPKTGSGEVAAFSAIALAAATCGAASFALVKSKAKK